MFDNPTITELLTAAAGPTYSFEFFPPKDDEGRTRLLESLERLEPLEPDFVSVTYGANGSNRARTLALTIELAQRTSATVIGHLTCASQSVDEITAAVDAYGEAGICNILAVRGDMPGGVHVPWEPHPHGLANATELVELVKSRGDFCVGVGAFPDGHAGSSLELDAQIMKDKQDAGAEFAISQLFFDPQHYQSMVARARELGVTMPIFPGIMPVTSVKQLDRFAEMSNADVPASVAEKFARVADDPVMVRTTGSLIASELCAELLDSGAPGLQFFTQNRSVATREILAMLRAAGR